MSNPYIWIQVGRHPHAGQRPAPRSLGAPLRSVQACRGDACSSGDLPCPTPQHCGLVAPAPAEACSDIGADTATPPKARPMPDGAGFVVAVICGLSVYCIGALAWLVWRA